MPGSELVLALRFPRSFLFRLRNQGANERLSADRGPQRLALSMTSASLADRWWAEKALRYLQQYGLDAVRAAEDDPLLWACVLDEHWSPPLERFGSDVRYLRFSILGKRRSVSTRSGRVELEVWGFEWIEEEQRLKAVARVNDRRAKCPISYLEIERPSRLRDTALVHEGALSRPMMGMGWNYRWRREADGFWMPGKCVGDWIS